MSMRDCGYQRSLFAILWIAALLGISCGGAKQARDNGKGYATRSTTSTKVNGAGATFPAPIYQKWSGEYRAAHPEAEINYQGRVRRRHQTAHRRHRGFRRFL